MRYDADESICKSISKIRSLLDVPDKLGMSKASL